VIYLSIPRANFLSELLVVELSFTTNSIPYIGCGMGINIMIIPIENQEVFPLVGMEEDMDQDEMDFIIAEVE
jgi:hypothetical protein